ncbi:hypothetical protein [uncultured Desulfobacter sp.]|uniref:hypothetical protein n=1 Tax=uncultured Desulfobacter sp. TaxID=240139 RepID=UPI0029F522D1|nr:hypothetical protein [uncultured Desulfobacter sp.]
MTSELIQSGNKNPKWIAEVGMVLIKLTDKELINSLDEGWEQTEDHRGFYERTINIHRDVESFLKKCPDIKNMRRLGDLREEHFEPFEHHNCDSNDQFLSEASAFLYFELFIPKSERTYAFDVRYHENVVEKACVIYNGVFFLAFAETTERSSTALLGQEIREFLKRRLVSTQWEAFIVPPCPLHPDIFVSILPELDKLKAELDDINDIKITLPVSEKNNIVDFFEYFLFENSFSIAGFLSACTMQQKATEISYSIEARLQSLTEVYEKLTVLPWYRIQNKLKLMKQSRKIALDLQMRCNEFAKYRLDLKKKKKSFSQHATETWNETIFRSYFYKHLKEPILSISEIRESVKHMTDIVSQRYLQYFTVMAALVGGIVGAIITNIPFIYTIFSEWLKKNGV